MTTSIKNTKQTFYVELIKPSHYDDDGYIIRWRRSFSISNSLSCLFSLSQDAAQKRVLGNHVDIVVNSYDDFSTVIPTKKIIKRLLHHNHCGLICLVGVQSNQFPRAVDIARPFCDVGIPVVIGGFHVSGTIAMSPNIPNDLKKALDMKISLFAGEAEGQLPQLFSDAYHNQMKPIYNTLENLPDLRGQPTPLLSQKLINKSLSSDIPIDTSRGCPFNCSFCTIINVQGRESRSRSADDVEKMIRTYSNNRKKTGHFFFTDDNFARNKNWRAILDRLIYLKEQENFSIKFGIQIDAQAHKIPHFIDKVARAGCNWVFIGIESINPSNLKAANKPQNHVSKYQEMLNAWRSKKIITIAGYILGFPEDDPESIEQDINTIQQELPIDILMFFCLTPLPGSEDYKKMVNSDKWMDPDFNKYDSEHATIDHPKMSRSEWEGIFRKAWDIYYSPEHIEMLLRKAITDNINASRLTTRILISYCGMKYGKVHPFQNGIFRRKIRAERRQGMPFENPLIFYPKRLLETLNTNIPILIYSWKLERLAKRLKHEIRR